MVVNAALICLALNVYHEARFEQLTGQYAVALVTMNRVSQNKSKVCDEVFKRKQFSWTIGKVQKFDYGWALENSLRPRDKRAWEIAKTVASIALEKRMPDFTMGATYFHADYVRPYWASSVKRTMKVGRHIFYTRRKPVLV